MKIVLLDPKCLPVRTYNADAGLDLKTRESVILLPFQRRRVKTGVCVEIPRGYSGDIRPRSGYSYFGIDCLYGTVDNGFTGEMSIVLRNISFLPKRIKKYTRIAQLVIVKLLGEEEAELEIVDKLPDSPRGNNGFNSTGG